MRSAGGFGAWGRQGRSAPAGAREVNPDSPSADTYDQTCSDGPAGRPTEKPILTRYTRLISMPRRLHPRSRARWRACLALCSSVSVHTQAKRPMTLVDLLNIPRVGDPQISPDGRAITFMLSTADWPANRRVAHLWRINTDGTGLRRLSSEPGPPPSARWSPDSSSIAFLSGGSVFVMPAAGGRRAQVSKRTGVSDIAWHPNGAFIYFLAFDAPTDAERERQRLRGDVVVLDETRPRHLWRMAVADGTETRVTSGPDYVFAYRIAASGERIIISRRPTRLPADSDKMELWNIAADGSAQSS